MVSQTGNQAVKLGGWIPKPAANCDNQGQVVYHGNFAHQNVSDTRSFNDIDVELRDEISRSSFNEINNQAKVTEGIVKSLGKSYFAERAGLIGDIIKQVEKDKAIDPKKAEEIKEAMKNTPLGKMEQQAAGKLMFVTKPPEPAKGGILKADGVDLFAAAKGAQLIMPPKQQNQNPFKEMGQPQTNDKPIDIDDWLLEDNDSKPSKTKPVPKQEKKLAPDAALGFLHAQKPKKPA